MIEKFNKTQRVFIAIYVGIFILLTVFFVPWEYDYIRHNHTFKGSKTDWIFTTPSSITWDYGGFGTVRNLRINTSELMRNLFILTMIFGLLVFLTGDKKKT